MSVLAVVQARMSSRRLFGKVLADVGGRPLLDLLVARLRRARRLDRIVIATSTNPADRAVADWAAASGLAVVLGPEADVLARFGQVLGQYKAQVIVRVTADNPFTDPDLIDAAAAIVAAGEFDYVDVPNAPLGTAVHVFHAAVLRRSIREARGAYQREHINAYVLDNPHLFRIGRLSSPLARPDLSFTVDNAADLDHVRVVAGSLTCAVAAGIGDLVAVADGLGPRA